MNRTLNVTTPLGPERLRFDMLQGREALSALFDLQLTLKSEEKGVSADDLLGQSISVDFELDGGARRHLNGQCVHFRSAGRRGKQHLYIANLRPCRAAFYLRHVSRGRGRLSVAGRTADPTKYNKAMLEMLEYFKCLQKNGLLP